MDTITERLRLRVRESRRLSKELNREISALEEAAGREASWEQAAKVDHVCRQLEILINHIKSKPKGK